MPVGKHYDLDTDVTLANNSDNTIASQKATKTYVDNNYVPNSALEEAATVAKTGDYNDLINKPTIDSELSTTSTNAVQNKIITTELNKKIQQNDILQNLNNHNSSDRTRIWLSSLDNTLYRSNKRFTVTLTDFDTTDSTNLFDMNWDSDVRISSGKIGIINITGGTNLGMSYPYGYIYISFYGGNSPTDISQISGRLYQDWSGHNTGWVNLPSFTAISTGNYGGVQHIKVARVSANTYGIQQIEISINNTDGVGYENSKIWVTQVEFFCTRTGIGSLPVLTKRGGDTIYGNLTIPTANGSFIGNLTGNATTATGVTTAAGTDNVDRVVYFANTSATTTLAKPVFDNDFKYNPSTNVLTVGSITGTAAKATADASGNVITTTYATKSELPTVNNKTITIQKNGTTVDSFTLNQSTDKNINITVPTKTSDITNDSGFLTSHQSIKSLKTDNTTAQTASSSETIAGSGTINLHKVSKTGSYNDLLNKPTIPTVNNSTITIQKNGTNVDSFTTNASSNKSINITLAKGDVGLGNVDNTSDANKPISTATQTALDGKQNTINDLTKIRDGSNSFYVKGTQTASTPSFTGVLSAVSELYEGLTIDYWLPFAGTTAGDTLNLTLAGDVETGPINCYYQGTTRLTTHLAANNVGRFIYQTVTISGTNYTGWWLLRAYYTEGSNTYDREYDNYYRGYAGMALPKYGLLMKGVNGRLYSIVATYETATTKVVTTVGLRPDLIWWNNSNATTNAGAAIKAQALYRSMPSTAGSSVFNASVPTYCDIYLCGDYDENTGLFYLATTDANGNASVTDYYRFVPYNSEPVYSNYFITGRYYIFVGSSYSTANYYQLMDQHPMYYYDGTNLIGIADKPKYAATFIDWE